MALKIRLRRMGRRNAPTYRIVVAESARSRDGRIVENIGHYNPRTEPLALTVNRGRALHWLGMGATPTETAKALLKKAGVFRPEEESVLAEAAEAAKSGASSAAAAVKDAAAATVAAAGDVVDEVKEAVTGGDEAESAEEAPAAQAEAAPEAEAETAEEAESKE